MFDANGGPIHLALQKRRQPSPKLPPALLMIAGLRPRGLQRQKNSSMVVFRGWAASDGGLICLTAVFRGETTCSIFGICLICASLTWEMGDKKLVIRKGGDHAAPFRAPPRVVPNDYLRGRGGGVTLLSFRTRCGVVLHPGCPLPPRTSSAGAFPGKDPRCRPWYTLHPPAWA